MHNTSNLKLRLAAKEFQRILRKSQTTAEIRLWKMLRNRRFYGLKFYRQHPIFYEFNDHESFFIVDFFCFEKKIVIELDGKIHQFKKSRDQQRSFIIRTMNLKEIRFPNEEIISDIHGSLLKLAIHCDLFKPQ